MDMAQEEELCNTVCINGMVLAHWEYGNLEVFLQICHTQ
jgi:hypothetical protein